MAKAGGFLKPNLDEPQRYVNETDYEHGSTSEEVSAQNSIADKTTERDVREAVPGCKRIAAHVDPLDRLLVHELRSVVVCPAQPLVLPARVTFREGDQTEAKSATSESTTPGTHYTMQKDCILRPSSPYHDYHSNYRPLVACDRRNLSRYDWSAADLYSQEAYSLSSQCILAYALADQGVGDNTS
ncbi:unnamed protein product [Pleuronectes platessa]|uniref:Uncharacterized protein n=1 Tax=Pleuronectes platessa TaxID=8262 RepID=A0A9N7VCU4_PLEPL|nr:unnamed protein product [Pleuronectes platessa]